MATYNKQEIQRRARGGHAITFLRSEEVAKAVAKKVEAELKKRKVGGTEVVVRQDPRRPGAWRVWVAHYALHAPRGSDMARAYYEANKHEWDAINAILDEAYTPGDLLTSWSSPRRR